MKKYLLAALLTVATCVQAQSIECDESSCLDDAREVIADLNRIVTPDGVQESYEVRIGGIDQWVYVRGKDTANPIILFVHGGPAAPLSPSMWQFQRPLEEYFTIVNWDQRGAGKTFLASDPDSISDTIHISQYVSDTIELAETIKRKYGAEKLILMAHSWGTVPGMNAALTRADLFHAYVGIGQVINTRTNEKLSFEYGLERARKERNVEAIREMESIAPYPGDEPITRERIVIARKWPQYYGGLTAYRHDSKYYFRAPTLSPEYDEEEAAAIDRGSVFTLGRILPEFLQVDFTPIREFPIPVVMFMGRHDYTTPSQPTAEWLEAVRAPYKQGVWFENSAHMMPHEEPGKMLLSLVTHVRPLATSGSPPSAEASVEYLDSGKVIPANLPFSEAVRVGHMLYLSGQIGSVPGTTELVPGGIEAEARQVMENIRTSLEAHGYSMQNLVKCTVMLADMGDWPAFNEVYRSFFSGDYPARSAFGANGLAMGARVEVECIAAAEPQDPHR